MKCTKNDSGISIFKDLNWVVMSLICIICSHTLLVLSKVWHDSFFVRVLAKTLLGRMNCSTTAFRNTLALSLSRIEPQMLFLMWDFMNNKYKWLDRSYHSFLKIYAGILYFVRADGSSTWSATSSSKHPNFRRIFSFQLEKL